MTISNQKLFRIFSAALVAISLIFLASRLIKYQRSILSHKWDITTVSVVIAGALCYMFACLLLSTAWKKLLEEFGQKDLTSGICHFIYGRTLIAKYIPGNIFQIVGRHLLGSKLGLRHETLTYAAFYEIIGIACVASLMSLLGFMFSGFAQTYFSTTTMLITLFIAIALAFLTIGMVPLAAQYFGHSLTKFDFTHAIRKVFPIYGLYIVFLAVCGLILFGTILVISPASGWHMLLFSVGIFSLSWLAGFITPGSPSGLGVREAVLVLALGKVIGESDSFMIAFLLRIITILGDLLFFTAVCFFFRPPTLIRKHL